LVVFYSHIYIPIFQYFDINKYYIVCLDNCAFRDRAGHDRVRTCASTIAPGAHESRNLPIHVYNSLRNNVNRTASSYSIDQISNATNLFIANVFSRFLLIN